MKIGKLLICAVIILISLSVIAYNLANRPKPRRGKLPSMAPAASVYQVKTGSVPIYIDTIATLIPYQSISLQSEVSGTAESLSEDFEAGAIIKKGDILVSLEKRDYQNEVRKLEATLAKVKADYSLELGHQKIVQEELKELKKMSNTVVSNKLHTELTLRKPQLDQVLADLAIAEANLLDAQYDLEETEIKAPFDALVLSRAVSVGQHISTGGELAELVSIEKYLADVAIPVDALYNNQLLSYKSKDIPIEITTNFGEKWQGKLEQVVSALTTESRMGKIIISIEDPLATAENNKRVPLLLGDQINVRILAGTYNDVVQLPRQSVYNNENIWLITEDNKLKYQKVEIVWSDGNNVYIRESALKNNSLVLHSDINNPVENLVVKPTIINLSEEEKIKQEEQEKIRREKIQQERAKMQGGKSMMRPNTQNNPNMQNGKMPKDGQKPDMNSPQMQKRMEEMKKRRGQMMKDGENGEMPKRPQNSQRPKDMQNSQNAKQANEE